MEFVRCWYPVEWDSGWGVVYNEGVVYKNTALYALLLRYELMYNTHAEAVEDEQRIKEVLGWSDLTIK